MFLVGNTSSYLEQRVLGCPLSLPLIDPPLSNSALSEWLHRLRTDKIDIKQSQIIEFNSFGYGLFYVT